MKILKQIGKIFLWTLLTLVLIYNLYSYISLNILKKDLAGIWGYSILEVVSGSMDPEISVGDLIVINQNDKDYQVNSIITFKDESGTLVTHRIKEIDGDKIITKGDANNSQDEGYRKKEDVVGKYMFKISKLGYIVKSIKNPITLISILIMGIIICVLISTDENGMPIDIDEDEKDFLDNKKQKIRELEITKKREKSNKVVSRKKRKKK